MYGATLLSGLQSITVGEGFNQDVEMTLPRDLQELTFGDDVAPEDVTLPTGPQSITFGDDETLRPWPGIAAALGLATELGLLAECGLLAEPGLAAELGLAAEPGLLAECGLLTELGIAAELSLVGEASSVTASRRWSFGSSGASPLPSAFMAVVGPRSRGAAPSTARPGRPWRPSTARLGRLWRPRGAAAAAPQAPRLRRPRP